jgi:hypothetical protein
MRTPLRLAATIAKFRIAQAARGKGAASPLYRWILQFGAGRLVAVTGAAAAAGGEPVVKGHLERAKAKRAEALLNAPFASSPIVWLTGPAELLDFSATPGLARWLQEAGRTVFVETDGGLLRRRIHEFRPDARLYLTIRLYGMAATHDLRMQKQGAFAQAMEGIRAARLSGFLICGHVVIEGPTDIGEIDQLLRHLRSLKVDGVVVTTNEGSSGPDQRKLAAARKLIGHAWWAKFSRLAQKALSAPAHNAETFAAESVAPGTMAQVLSNSTMNISAESAASGGEMAAQ